MFSRIFIDDFCNFNKFTLDFPTKEDKNPNLNILIGKNGSGKSCFLDALFNIAENNLVSKIDFNVDNTKFNYEIALNDKIIVENPKIHTSKTLSEEEAKKHLWHKIIRLYTGSTQRQIYSNNDNILSFGPDDSKWALLAVFLSGQRIDIDSEEYKLWDKVQKIAIGLNPDADNNINKKISPQIIWVDLADEIEGGEKCIFADDFFDWDMNCPRLCIQNQNGTYRYFWNISDCRRCNPDSDPVPLFEILKHIIELKEDERLVDTGFLYTQETDGEILPSEYLSDGEFGLLSRFALLIIARDIKEKSLILLDEPETHFNEYWKTWFLALVCETLANNPHDVFIATHSAMLITDAKKGELLRLENKKDGIKQLEISLSTYGANIIDIGKTLFQMESDIGERSKKDIEDAIKEGDRKVLNNLLKQVGPGEWRWKIRAKLNQLEKADSCCNYEAKRKSNAKSRRKN